MKKKFILSAAILAFATTSCGKETNITFYEKPSKRGIENISDTVTSQDSTEGKQNINTNKKTDFSKLFYQTKDYFGGTITEHIIYFQENKYMHQVFDERFNLISRENKTFRDEDKAKFINSINESGLLNIKDEYINEDVNDGGEWSINISFDDGTDFNSKGINDGPDEVFMKCAIPFFELTGEEIFTLPSYYRNPADVSTAFKCGTSNPTTTTDMFKKAVGNYKWNIFVSLDNDYYEINRQNAKYNTVPIGYSSYDMLINTVNYNYEVKFSLFTLTEYDFYEELTNETLIYSSPMFKSASITIKPEKIYVYRLPYDDGNYVEYTFSTHIG